MSKTENIIINVDSIRQKKCYVFISFVGFELKMNRH